jgi:aminoglycoside phosphotransferase family enzyme/predicted kinase
MSPKTETAQAESQQPVFALLSNPATHGGQPVKRIDTHAASVFLAGDTTYKVKRAVRFPFLDYSTLAKRKAACEAELKVNKPFAPAIYRRVVAITREPDGRHALDGGGTPVEWAVEMRRFDESRTLDHVAENDTISDALAEALGRICAAAHDKSEPVAAEPWIAALASYLDQNDAAFRDFPDLFARAEIDALTASSRSHYDRVRALLVTRGRNGLIRRGHGDLHLGNIVLIDGEPVLFDAIEFDPLIASGDVLYDLAFLLMDLMERDLRRAANTVFNRYLAETRRPDDLDALTALPLFLSVRAAIRAKVTAARLANAAPDDRAAITRRARRYFELACRLIAPPPPRLVAVGGLSGTGKSVLARALAAELLPAPGAVVLRSDVERKALFGKHEQDKLPSEAYQADVSGRVYRSLADQARRVIAAGHCAIVDAVFARGSERSEIAAVAKAAHVPFRGLFLTADLATRTARVGTRTGDASDADTVVARAQEEYDLGTLDWAEVDASGTPEETLAHAQKRLA